MSIPCFFPNQENPTSDINLNQKKKSNRHWFVKKNDHVLYSLVRNADAVYFHAVLSPTILKGDPDLQSDVQVQIQSLISELNEVLVLEKMSASVVHLVVFLKSIGDKQLVRLMISDAFGQNCPVITYVPQTPGDGSSVLFEVWAVRSVVSDSVDSNSAKTNPIVSNSTVSTPTAANSTALGALKAFPLVERLDEQTVVVRHSGIAFCHSGGLSPCKKPVGSYTRSVSVFEKMEQSLKSAGFEMSDVLRTWIYQGHIVLPEGETQRYKELNRARTDFFNGTSFLTKHLPKTFESRGAIYPASTGIGADDVDVAMSAFAWKSERTDIAAVPLENPGQTPAFDYEAFYSPQSPKFSRAMAFAYDDSCTVLVSGTASITDSKTRFLEDPAGQARQTIENIRLLISGDNLRQHGIDGFESEISDLCVARVYVKRPAEYDIIRQVCEEEMSNIPIIYTIADVCRPDLLVEIEGIAACRSVK